MIRLPHRPPRCGATTVAIAVLAIGLVTGTDWATITIATSTSNRPAVTGIAPAPRPTPVRFTGPLPTYKATP